jgi:signal transduction histidine kinase
MLDAIVRGSGRIDNIVRELLDITRLREGRLTLASEQVDLAALLADTVANLALTTTRHRLVVTRLDPAVVRGDHQRLENVFINLLSNAIKFSPNGGDVEIAAERGPSEVVVSITDHGVGIPRSKQGDMFQQFYSAHVGTPFDYGGMGVGLYISREIVGRHGGRIWFESQEGRGSTFHVALPLRPEDVDPASGRLK